MARRPRSNPTLGWYLRNCIKGDYAQQLRTIVEEYAPYAFVSQEAESEELLAASEGHFIDPLPLNRLRALFKRFRAATPTDCDLETNARFAAEEFDFDDLDVAILLFVLRYDQLTQLEHLADRVDHALHGISQAVSALIGAPEKAVHARLLPGGALIETGMLSIEGDGHGLSGPHGRLRLTPALRETMHRPYASRAAWRTAIIGAPLADKLAWDDYAHLGQARDLVARILTGAAETRTPGINILLHGPVGTGKTELAKTLAARTGCDVWPVGETSKLGGEPSRSERLAALRLAQRVLARRGRSLLIFDEAEDALTAFAGVGPKAQGSSKVFLCRLLEENPVPIIWTCNRTNGMDASVLRRMTVAMEVPLPNAEARERIWAKELGANGFHLAPEAVRDLARRYPASPALMAGAVRGARLAGGGEADIETALAGVLTLLGAPISPPSHRDTRHDNPSFHGDLVNCREDLAGLVERLSRPGAPRAWSMSIEGVPGTGKSRFARFLAERLGMEVLHKRASDLLSPYVGATEERIARAFAEAREREALLVLDEADSFLQDRSLAQRGWEITQVNEMLTWMESHPLPFVCTTNFAERLDPATLRRFTFKLCFEPLTTGQTRLAFERFFGVAPVHRLPEGLVAGDFATVRRKARALGDVGPQILVRWLEDEASAKGCGKRPIGFTL